MFFKKLAFISRFTFLQSSRVVNEQRLQEYTNRQEKVEKYLKRERTGPNVVKLENSRKACAIAKMDFDSQNSILMDEVPRLYEGRIAYFQPSLQALIKAQIKYYTDSQDTYSKLCKQLNSSSSSPTQDPVQLRQNIQQKLTEIRALSIAVDDQAK